MRVRTRTSLIAVVLLAAVCSVLAVGAADPAAAALTQPGQLRSFGRAIEVYAPYQPQTQCLSRPSKGAVLLSRWLLTRYKGSTSSGIMRACTRGSGSEHKDGRAFDWHVDYRTSRGRAQGKAFLALARATDRYGNAHAIARRLGIMYIIWNDRIYSAGNDFHARPYRNSACPSGPVTRCSTTLRHIDHMHISLGWSGARAITSFWDGTVAPVTDPPPPPALDQRRHPVVKYTVPAAGRTLKTSFSLAKGVRYRFVANGYYRFGPGSTQVGDAACSWHRDDDAGWSPTAEGTTSRTRLHLTVNGASGWRPRSGGSGCDPQHVYVWDYVPTRTAPATITVADPQPWDNGTTTLTFRVLRAGASASGYSTSVPRPAAAPAVWDVVPGTPLVGTERRGVSPLRTGRTVSALVAGQTYDVTVTGTWDGGDGLLGDAECTRTPQGTWRPRRSLDPLHPTTDHGDLYLDGRDLADQACRADHTYRYTFVPTRDGRPTLAIWDPARSDDSGALAVEITPRAG